MKLYVDMDGVLADFDKSAEAILQTDNIYKYEFIWGPDRFWEELNTRPDFFRNLPMMGDAKHLWSKIAHLNPEVLTALPRENGERVSVQKREWITKNIDNWSQPENDTIVHTCPTRDKPKLCKPGDILIDDRAVNRDAWMKAGGIYIVHTSAANTLTTLRALGVIK
jgi:5'(3')-deoxyribonucleotidase